MQTVICALHQWKIDQSITGGAEETPTFQTDALAWSAKAKEERQAVRQTDTVLMG